ncbi:MAG: FliA/WhiG family RNA polymerase sigma factor [Paenibacillaceae bacterium]
MVDRQSTKLISHELWLNYKTTGNSEAKKALIELYIRLIDYVVNRMAIGLPKSVSRDDLYSHGSMGLIDAIDKFDYNRGLQFETYASWRIRGSIIDGLRQGDWVPRSVREKAKRLEEAYQKLEQEHLRSVSDKEIMTYLQVNEQEFQQMLQDVSITTICSLEDPLKEDDSETRLSLLIDDKAINPESKVNEIYMMDVLSKGIERLTDKERTVVSLFYYDELSLSEIAEVMSLTPSRISQLHSKAILRLRGLLSRTKNQLLQD